MFKVPAGPEGEYHIQDIYGNIRRVATVDEIRSLRNPKSYSPALAEDAIRAFNGMGPWLEAYDEMLADWDEIHGLAE
ncbi:hypothetical protein [Planotetraspora sp. GP83]|uniref:hypothetical protein n=1 Tax=Planotetraspora sp. GP83 TaxID=3156264 RepID=UPI003518B2F8